MKIIVTVKDTENIIGVKEDIAARLEGAMDIVGIDVSRRGVIITPCEVRDRVYMPWFWGNKKGVIGLTVTHIIVDSIHSYIRTNLKSDCEDFLLAYNHGRFDFKDFGRAVFRNKADAEKALKKRSGEG